MFKQLLCVLVLAVAVSTAASISIPEEDMQAIFTGYMTRMNKVYERSQFFHRYHIFKTAYAFILAHNALPDGQNKGVKLGATSLSDLTREEYRQLLGFKPHGAVIHHKLRALPEGEIADDDSIDWVAKGAVNAIKDQGKCGACWAFSAVAATESALFLANHKLPSLSEQQLVDCAMVEPYECSGCGGCIMAKAYDYILDNGGLCSEKEYPYTAKDGECKASTVKTCKRTQKPIQSYKYITCEVKGDCDKIIPRNETTIKAYVQQGVVSIAIEADSDIFKHYSSGILDDPSCGTELDHGVAIVGYGTENGQPYWTVRNSWGTSWGEQGYVRIAQGKNMCGLAAYAQQAYA